MPPPENADLVHQEPERPTNHGGHHKNGENRQTQSLEKHQHGPASIKQNPAPRVRSNASGAPKRARHSVAIRGPQLRRPPPKIQLSAGSSLFCSSSHCLRTRRRSERRFPRGSGLGPSISGMYQQKPDITSYTHFLGSEAFGTGSPDSGTSAACPVAAGCVAALRSSPKSGPGTVTPVQMIGTLQQTARNVPGQTGWNGDYGFGIIDPVAAATKLGL